jgi:chloramphenicol-sensitive protein RarD
MVSLTAETLSVAPFAAGYLVWSLAVHHAQLAHTPAQLVLLALSGPMTAVPLLLFGAAAHRLPIVSIGVLQYLTPILQFLWAVLVRHEHLSATAWIGFGLIWIALVIFTVDALALRKRPKNASR